MCIVHGTVRDSKSILSFVKVVERQVVHQDSSWILKKIGWIGSRKGMVTHKTTRFVGEYSNVTKTWCSGEERRKGIRNTGGGCIRRRTGEPKVGKRTTDVGCIRKSKHRATVKIYSRRQAMNSLNREPVIGGLAKTLLGRLTAKYDSWTKEMRTTSRKLNRA